MKLTFRSTVSMHPSTRVQQPASPPPEQGPIAFTAALVDDKLHRDIYTMQPDGSNQVRLKLPVGGVPTHPTWAPSGTKLAFGLRQGSSLWNLWVMDLKTSQATQITFFPAGEGPVWQPAWSPNGEEIAFERGTVDGPPQRTRRIYVVKADGSEEVPRILTGTSHDSNHPTWSPDGSRIAFSRSKTNSNDYDICTMTPEGKEIKVLTKGGEPAWSPGGKSIAYFSVAKAVKGNENPTDISVIALPNGKPQKLTSTPRDDLEPAWSPDGKRILFVEHRHVNPGLPGQGTDLYAMDADGSNRVRLTFDTTRRFWSPDWQPATALVAPSKVVFQTELANMAMDFPGPQPDWTVTSTIEVEPQRGLLPTEEPKRGR